MGQMYDSNVILGDYEVLKSQSIIDLLKEDCFMLQRKSLQELRL